LIPDATAAQPSRILLCSGKVYYDLLEYRTKNNRTDVAIVRMEQLYPYPEAEVEAILNAAPKAEYFWVQEEPRNMGAWRFIYSHLQPKLNGDVLHYSGRVESASPATGFEKKSGQEQAALIEDAFTPLDKRKRA
jgi:2-oxoglutarate dehydrogenase complex dehydrogenase (E1) component-like enzyme